ncbi:MULTISPECIES: DUF2628 domain-containing protein [unclassified Priestia]|uniref:DUF2628 domain-containing protein n=1 Tax=unclassified Priestia TaxID=2800374 RepID=UPI00138F0F4C|nr:DUF2628 domain-containing protein [Priestia megaterium]
MEEQAVDELMSFEEEHKVVRTNTSYYDLKWGKTANPAKNNTWNWAAFFLTSAWFAYRKMYKHFFILTFIEVIWFSLLCFVDIPEWSDAIVFGGASLITGLCANRWYYKHVKNVLARAGAQPEQRKEAYLQIKGGTHIGIAIGLSILALVITFGVGAGLSLLPTKTNIKDVVRYGDEAITLETYNDHPKWTYIKQEGRHHVVQFTGYDYTEKEHIRIVFNVYLDKQIYEWDKIYINGKKLNKKDAEDYEYWIEDSSAY